MRTAVIDGIDPTLMVEHTDGVAATAEHYALALLQFVQGPDPDVSFNAGGREFRCMSSRHSARSSLLGRSVVKSGRFSSLFLYLRQRAAKCKRKFPLHGGGIDHSRSFNCL